jgi:hypothetical protein
MRRLAAVLLALPLMVAGGVCAHWLAYRLAVPDVSARSTLLAATGHAYVAWLPVLIGVLSALAVLAAAGLVLGRGSLLERLRLRPGVFVWLPIVAFCVQEHVERLSVGYGSPWHVWQEPTFWRGLLLQVPFGLAAYLVAALLLRGARALRAVIVAGRPRPRAVTVLWPARRVGLAERVLVRRVRGGDALRFRGPPAGVRCCLS